MAQSNVRIPCTVLEEFVDDLGAQRRPAKNGLPQVRNLPRDARQDMWQLIRLWLFDYYFPASKGYPFAPARTYHFTAAVMHAVSHWKPWVARIMGENEAKLTTHYKRTNTCGGETVEVWIPPDAGEYKYHDYLLLRKTNTESEIICALESEGGKKSDHIQEDLPKLLRVKSCLKVMIYRMPYIDVKPPDDAFHECKETIECMFREHPEYIASSKCRSEQWLFLGIPWYREGERYRKGKWPKHADEAYVRVNVLETPCDMPIKVKDPDWNIWEPATEMDQWLRSLYRPELAD